jgi:hypothetical protein
LLLQQWTDEDARSVPSAGRWAIHCGSDDRGTCGRRPPVDPAGNVRRGLVQAWADLPEPRDAAGLARSFGVDRAVDTIDLTIASAEIHALVGLNGGGKPP